MLKPSKKGMVVFGLIGLMIVGTILYYSFRAFAPDFVDQATSRIVGLFPGSEAKPAQLANLAQKPGSFTPANNLGVPEFVPPPSARLAKLAGDEFRIGTYFWSGNITFHYAFGGAPAGTDPTGNIKIFGTSEGSFMDKYGVKVRWKRMDDTGPMLEQISSFAHAYKNDPHTKMGIHGFTIMGDGAGVAITGPNQLLEKELGPDYIIQAVDFFGASNGEDGMWGPPEWVDNPQLALGSIIAVVSTGDVGDFNVVAIWCDNNKLVINMDQTTYDPDAVNIMNPATYIDTGIKFASRTPDTRHYTIVNGQRIKKTTVHAIDAYCSWTPVDYDVAKVRQDVVKIYSTADNTNQMACTLFVIKKWAEDNRPTMDNIVAATAEAGRQIKNYDEALDAACAISARIYGELPEKDGAWIKRFYQSDPHRDAMGRPVLVKGRKMILGGSRAFDMTDKMFFMGLLPGYEQVKKYQEVYELFADLYLRLNPEFLTDGYFPASRAINPSFVRDVAGTYMDQFRGQTASTTPTLPGVGEEATGDVLGHADYTIEFASGSAQLTARGTSELEDLYVHIGSGNVALQVHGHTDKNGDADANMTLSRQRGNTVKAYLMKRSPLEFPDRRIKVIPHGEDDPKNLADTPEAYAKNRRVEIYQLRVNQ